MTVFGPSFSPLLALKALTSFEEGTLPTLPESYRGVLRNAAARVDRIPVVGARHARVLPEPEAAS